MRCAGPRGWLRCAGPDPGRTKSGLRALAVDETSVVAEVTDDGIGFEPAQTTGSGLISMKERLALIGGDLEVNSSHGRGVGIRTVIPLSRNAANHDHTR